MTEETIEINRKTDKKQTGNSHPYKENYLVHACPAMGTMFETGLMAMQADRFTQLFLESRISTAWENGNPAYLAGKSGIELSGEVTGVRTDAVRLSSDPGDTYWCGYVYCFAQWYFGCTFERLLGAVPVEELLRMYPALHEADISKIMQVILGRLAVK